MLNTALLMIMIGLFGGYAVVRIGQSYLFFKHPIFCVCFAALLTGFFHWAGKLTRNEDLYYLGSISAVLFWYGQTNYKHLSKRVETAEDVFKFEQVEEGVKE